MITAIEKPNVRSTKYGPRENNPVNPATITRIEKTRECYYPDNEGIPTIKFHFIGESKPYQWYFDKGEEALRDEVFDRITKPLVEPPERDK